MKKINNMFLMILILVICFFSVNISKVFAEENKKELINIIKDSSIGNEFKNSDVQTGNEFLKPQISRVFGILIVVLQVAAVSGVIFAGVRYMYASADQKADLKKSLIHLVIGMAIVFAASTVVGIVTGIFQDITG